MKRLFFALGILFLFACNKTEVQNTPIASTPKAPSSPTGIKSTPGFYSITLSWDNPNNQNNHNNHNNLNNHLKYIETLLLILVNYIKKSLIQHNSKMI